MQQIAGTGTASAALTHDFTASIEPTHVSLFTALSQSLGEIPRILLRDTGVDETSSPLVRPGSTEMPRASDRSGRYQFLGEIARGGMGAILRGRDTELGRDLAIKVLLESHRDKPDLVRRFVEEAQIGGQLQHPGVVPVYDLGTFADLRPFFTMKLVKGETLAALLQRRKILTDNQPRLLAIFEQICQTMAYAHTRGVIHRDLKPSNVMVGNFGEVQVMDWGLAKILPRGGVVDDPRETGTASDVSVIQTPRSGSGADESEAGSVLGTPSYIAPEQARGELDIVNERSDVYGLGAILCEILTGQPPIVGKTSAEIMRKAGRGDLADAFRRLEECGADAELIAIARQSLAAEPEDRPASARELCDLITAYLAGVQDRLRRSELAQVEANARAIEERKRHKLTAALAASIIGTIVLGGAGWLYTERDRNARAARVELALSEAELLRGEAERAGNDPARWLRAREAAHALERLEADARDAATRRRASDVAAAVQAAAAAADGDRALLEKIADIRAAEFEDPNGAATDRAYTDGFRAVGLDLTALKSEEAGAIIKNRPAAVRVEMAAALDDWAGVKRSRLKDTAGSDRLTKVAQVADPDSWRDNLRATLVTPKGPKRLDALRALARSAQIDELPPGSVEFLGAALLGDGDPKAALDVLRPGQRRYPGDVWLNLKLAECLIKLARRVEAIRFLMVARSIAPATAHGLAHVLEEVGETEEAIAVLRDVARIRPAAARHRICLSATLGSAGRSKEARAELDLAITAARAETHAAATDPEAFFDLARALSFNDQNTEAIAAYRESIRLAPAQPTAHLNLGNLLKEHLHDNEGAVKEYREAVRLEPESARALTNLGIALAEQNKRDEAIAAFREAIRVQPDYVSAHRNLAEELAAQGKNDEAIQLYQEAIRRMPTDLLSYDQLGELLIKLGKGDSAIDVYRDAVARQPDHPRPHIGFGKALAELRKPDRAETEFREALRLAPNNIDALIGLGIVLADQKKFDEASAAYNSVLKIDPLSAAAHNNLGLVFVSLGKFEEGLREYRESIRLEPKDDNAYDNMAIALRKMGKLAEAIAAYEDGIKQTPGNASRRAALGILFFDTGQYQAALGQFREALRVEPGSATYHTNAANALFRLGEFDQALAEYREAIRLDPKFANAHNSMGSLLCDAKGEFAAAADEFRIAIALAPKFAEAHHNLGIALRSLGRADEAAAALREAIRLNPNYSSAHARLGSILCFEKHQYPAAIEELREAIRLDPNDPDVHFSLGRSLDALGKPDDALEQLRQAARLAPNDPKYHTGLGAVLCDSKHDFPAAAAEFRAALRIDPDNAEYHYNLGNALSGSGARDQAIAAFRKAIELAPNHAGARCNLGQRLREAGRFAEALAEFRKGDELGSKLPGWPYPSRRWVEDCEQLVLLESKIPAILNGDVKLAKNVERLAMAQLCEDRKWLAHAARFWADAFDADKALADDMSAQNRYTAACFAVLAASGNGSDNPPPSDVDKKDLRRRAIEWLRADLAYWTKQLESGSEPSRLQARRTLSHWMRDSDLDGIRVPESLKALSADERQAFLDLWATVEKLLARS